MYDYNNGEPERLLTKDELLDDVTLYWLTNSAASAARLYWETSGQSVLLAAAQKTAEISLPVAITVFPEEVYRAPETWARRAYRNLIYFNEVDKGGHFAAWEEPELFSCRAPRRVQVAPHDHERTESSCSAVGPRPIRNRCADCRLCRRNEHVAHADISQRSAFRSCHGYPASQSRADNPSWLLLSARTSGSIRRR